MGAEDKRLRLLLENFEDAWPTLSAQLADCLKFDFHGDTHAMTRHVWDVLEAMGRRDSGLLDDEPE